MSETQLMTAKELSEYLRLNPASIWRLTSEGKIPVIRLGKRTLRYSLPDVMKVLENGGEGNNG